MKRFQKVNSGFTRISDENLLILAETVLTAIGENAYFPEPEPALEEVETALEDFTDKLAQARRRGSPLDTAEKNASREILERVLSELAFYVNKIAQGQLPILLSSGFEVSKFRRSIMPPERVRNLRAEDGHNSGQMHLSFDAQPGIRMYEYRYAVEKDDNGELIWNTKVTRTTSSRRNLVGNLDPGKTYHLSARAINSRGVGDWSESISWIAR